MSYREQQRQKVTSIRKAFFKDPGNGIGCGPRSGHEPHYPPAEDEEMWFEQVADTALC